VPDLSGDFVNQQNLQSILPEIGPISSQPMYGLRYASLQEIRRLYCSLRCLWRWQSVRTQPFSPSPDSYFTSGSMSRILSNCGCSVGTARPPRFDSHTEQASTGAMLA
jgi:hypothetical protein